MQGRVADKVILISGGGGLKGQELAALLVREGARVIVTDVDANRAAEVVDFVGEPDRIRSSRLDVSDEDQWKTVLADIRETEGRLDVLINTARFLFFAKVEDVSVADWRKSTSVNLDGPFFGAKHSLPLLVEGGGGSVVNVLSLSAVQPNDTTPAYAACNAAILNLTHTIALQYAEANVRANSLVVGFSANSPLDDAHDLAKRLVPLGRPNNGDNIARAILWLISDDASYVTGTELKLDGGRSAGIKLR
jgi:NAD(P)-dependent dehydrogenase (short-subunit alcohol dehydrogenase family)